MYSKHMGVQFTSARRMEGFAIRALAIATRCPPPDSLSRDKPKVVPPDEGALLSP